MHGVIMEVIWDINQGIMRIQRDKATAVIIDLQEKLFPHILDHDHLAARTEILIRGLQVLKVPIILTQQYTKGLGKTILSIENLFDPFNHVEKTAFSCCDDPGFLMNLERTANDFIILAGIETHVCVLQTVLDLIERGFKPAVVEDCVSSREGSDKIMAINRMRQEGAIITSSESILFELCRYSGTDEFRKISSLIK
jgi:nicotinamidase-related amidase